MVNAPFIESLDIFSNATPQLIRIVDSRTQVSQTESSCERYLRMYVCLCAELRDTPVTAPRSWVLFTSVEGCTDKKWLVVSACNSFYVHKKEQINGKSPPPHTIAIRHCYIENKHEYRKLQPSIRDSCFDEPKRIIKQCRGVAIWVFLVRNQHLASLRGTVGTVICWRMTYVFGLQLLLCGSLLQLHVTSLGWLFCICK